MFVSSVLRVSERKSFSLSLIPAALSASPTYPELELGRAYPCRFLRRKNNATAPTRVITIIGPATAAIMAPEGRECLEITGRGAGTAPEVDVAETLSAREVDDRDWGDAVIELVPEKVEITIEFEVVSEDSEVGVGRF